MGFWAYATVQKGMNTASTSKMPCNVIVRIVNMYCICFVFITSLSFKQQILGKDPKNIVKGTTDLRIKCS